MSLASGAKSVFARFGLGNGDSRFAVGYFFLFLTYGVLTPFLQVLLKGLGYGSAEIGLYLGFFEAAGIGGQLVLARVADRSGRYRPWLYLTAALTVLAALPLALIRSPMVTFVAIGALAIGVRGMVPVMDAAVVSHTQAGAPRKKGSNYGLIRSIGTIGYICMLLLTQTVDLSRGSPLAIAGWTMGAGMAFMLYLAILPESGRAGSGASANAAPPKRELDPRLFLGLLIIALGRLAMAPINSFFTLYATEVVRTDLSSILWAISGAAEVPALIIAGRFIDRHGPMRILALSTLAIAARLLVYIFIPTVPGVIAGQLLHFLCFGFFQPAAIAFVSSCVPPERRVWGMSMFMGVGVGIPSFLGSAFGGIILARGGYDALFGWAIVPAALGLLIWALTAKRLGR